MALKVYTSGNYIITDTGTVMHEFAKGYTTYSYNQTSQIFTVRESVGGSFTVTRAQLLAGDIVDESSVAYTFNSFVTFLRDNTGFKTAPGGSGAAPIGAKLLKTNQSVSYRTGDDGDIEAGRSVDFFTLPTNNPFNNTNRFTDELGGTTYTNNIVIDWSTYDGSSVLGYRRTVNGAGVTWNDAIDGALAVSIGSFISGWRLPNVYELMNIWNGNSTLSFNYSPFNISTYNLWTSNTPSLASTVAWSFQVATIGSLNYIGKTTTNASGQDCRYIPVRTFTVSGTTLT